MIRLLQYLSNYICIILINILILLLDYYNIYMKNKLYYFYICIIFSKIFVLFVLFLNYFSNYHYISLIIIIF